jgi:ribosomal subunit interface protein
MDLVLKGRGVQVTDQIRRTVSLKLAKLERFESHALRVEVELIAEQNPRQDGTKRLEAALETPRHTYRARAQARDVDGALDQLVERLERQIRDRRGRKRDRFLAGANRLKSPRTSPEGAGSTD